MRRGGLATLVLAALLVTAAPALGAPRPSIGGCPVFPAANAWNRDITRAPVDPRSDEYVRSIGVDANLHPDFGSGRHGDAGIPLTVVPRTQRRVPVRFLAFPAESDPGPYPIPRDAPIEGGSDDHVLVVQRGTCRLYELFGARRTVQGWEAASGARFDLRTGALRPRGWTSADAAGLPIAPGLARADEVRAGVIRHALRVTVPRTGRAFRAPARHFASGSSAPGLPPMGLRLRLKASYSIRGFHGQARVILTALRRYGMIVADNGSPWFISGTPDRRWRDADLDQLKRVPASAFEAVRPSS
jgi:hypothetical protein